MSRLTLSSRLVLLNCALLLASAGAFAWLQVRSSNLEEQKLVQLLSVDVADHIAATAEVMDEEGLKPDAVRQLFDQLMTVNPSVEVYVLDSVGRILGHAAPPGHVQRDAVDVAPIERWLNGEPAPIFGDDPRSTFARKVFSAARLERAGRTWGYIYVILLGEARDLLATDVAATNALRTTLGWMAVVAVLGLLVGVVALRTITRPLRSLTESMHELDVDRLTTAQEHSPSPPELAGEKDEIVILKSAFGRMAARITDQWRALRQQEEQRRQFVASISHDLRTPLTSLQGYLETLESKGDKLSDSDRRRYLSAAHAQSERVGQLARELLDLARLEYDAAAPEKEPFSIVDLVQDVFEKLELLANEKRQKLIAEIPDGIPNVVASVSLIERALTNLLDNAIRHTPEGTRITLRLARIENKVEVTVADDGAGFPVQVRKLLGGNTTALDERHSVVSSGLGLRIVCRILELHDTRLDLSDDDGEGAAVSFRLETL